GLAENTGFGGYHANGVLIAGGRVQFLLHTGPLTDSNFVTVVLCSRPERQFYDIIAALEPITRH
ncbi:MAG: hypothetical protein ABEK50_17040, partial [bacterium]